MLTEKQIEANKTRFIGLISSIKIDGANVEGFLTWLEKSDFFTAPASSKYHCAYPGGLCEHSLNVYDSICALVQEHGSHVELNPAWNAEFGEEQEEPQYIMVPNYSSDTLKLVSLLHDISKTNFYETYQRNVKDENGQWVQVQEYKTRDAEHRFIYGSHEQNAEYMASTFFPLSVEERVAILHHHANQSWDSAQDNIAEIFTKFPLALFLHLADMLSTFVVETRDESNN